MPTVVELLQQRALAQPAECAYYFVDDGSAAVDQLTYEQLDQAARGVAAALAERGAIGRPVLVTCPPGRDYVVSFLGCLYAGATAVPVHPPGTTRAPRLRALVADSGAGIAIGSGAPPPELAGLDWIDAGALPAGGLPADALPADGDRDLPPPDPDALALLQYTSGSTGSPKGVMLSHANLWHNAELVQAGFGTSPATVGVSWLPPYHDMGLIGGILQPLYAGFPVVLMPPAAFLRRPLAWLEAISRFGATMSGAPNFAFDLCVRRSTRDQRAALDLSRWTLAFCGAEPVRAATLDRFAEAFAPAGFHPDAFYPCYGLAEATLIVTGGRPPRRTTTGHVACGRPLGQQRLAVVDPATGAACPPGVEGEVWLSGPSVAQGYWGRPEESAHTFGARLAGDPDRRYLRTGDLGYLDSAGELVVTGRSKDLVIVRGRNLHPEDVEHAVEDRVAGLRCGGSAAFGIERGGEEQLAIACEVAPPVPDPTTARARIAAIRQAVAETAGVAVATVVLLRPGQLPRTSSGKVQRYACRRVLLAGEWPAGARAVVARWEPSADPAGTAPPSPTGPTPRDRDPAAPEPELTALTELAAEVLELAPAAVPHDVPLTQLGLDSVRAIELLGTLQGRYGRTVAASELLSGATLAELGGRLRQPAAAAAEEAGAAEHAGARADGQRALWLLQRWAPDSTAYQISRAARIRTPVAADALERALRVLVDRHPALRTRLPARAGEPAAEQFRWSGPVLAVHDLAGVADDDLRARVQAAADRPFDLAEGPLLRVSLYTRAPADHVLLLSVHHTIADFWSLTVLADELVTEYHRAVAGEPAAEPEAAPAAEPAAAPEQPAYRTAPSGPGWEERLRRWREVLADAPPALQLPTTFPRPRVQSFRGDTHQFRLDPELREAVDEFAREHRLTRFAVLAAAVAAVLARYAGTDDLVLGAPAADRGGADRHRLGYLVNPVPLRIQVPARASFRDLARQVRGCVLDALDHAVPFPRLVEALRPARDPGRSPLLQVMLVLQQPPSGRPDLAAFAVADESARVRLGELDASPYRLAERGAAFDLGITLAEVDGGLTGLISYCTDLFDQPAIDRLAGHLASTLRRALSDPDAPVTGLDLLEERERAAVRSWSAGPAVAFSDRTTLPALFGQRAAARPEATAVVDHAGATVSYRELHDRAGRLAARLVTECSVGPGDLVGVYLPRGPDAVVAFWAALASGGAYLPLAPDLPPGRLAWQLADAQPKAVLTHRDLAGRLPAGAPPRIHLDEPPPAAPPPVVDRGGPDSLAYALYTSGSTGRPKAVLLDHRGACNLAEAEIAGLAVTPDSRLLQFASAGYDVHVSEILCAHLSGATLHIPPPEAAVPGQPLLDVLATGRITHAWMSPSVLAALPETAGATLPELATILCGGEACSPEVVARWAGGRRFLNGYGPAETTVCATWARCDPDDPRRPPIGSPLPNVRVYLLDARQELVPAGVPGEIYIAGAGVGWGYLGRPALTAERFLPDPFAAAPGARMYRTGDRARWLPDGRIDFLGRVDDQVQVRSVRVEPAEVAARLRELLPQARQVAVAARPAPGGGVELVAYLVVDPADRVPVGQLRGLLRAELPEPFLPAAFVHLDELPLNRSGKLDRSALPAPGPADRGLDGQLPPRTPTERTVAQVWAEALQQPAVGVRDHFFDQLGGSSLLVARIVGELGRRLDRDVPVTWMFEHPTVEALAQRLDHEGGSAGGEPAAGGPADGAAGPAPEEQAARRRQALRERRRMRHG